MVGRKDKHVQIASPHPSGDLISPGGAQGNFDAPVQMKSKNARPMDAASADAGTSSHREHRGRSRGRRGRNRGRSLSKASHRVAGAAPPPSGATRDAGAPHAR